MDPIFVPFTPRAFSGGTPHFLPVTTGTTAPTPPVDSPLKVWDGTNWMPAGVQVQD